MLDRKGKHRALVALYVAALLVVTLKPTASPMEWTGCVICGERGVADAIANGLIFVPLGVLLAVANSVRRRFAFFFPFQLSVLIECAQLFIPGRDPSLGDIIFNGLGGAAGAALAYSSALWMRPPEQVRASLSLASAVSLAGVIGLTGLFWRPETPAALYHGQWTPFFGHMAWYRGRVLDAWIGNIPAPSGPLPSSPALYAALLRGDSIRVRAVAGPPVSHLASLFSIYDEHQREIVLLGPRADDLIVRYRTRAASARLNRMDLLAAGALRGIEPGDTFTVAYWRTGADVCVAISDADPTCGLGPGPGRGWALVLSHVSLPAWSRAALDSIWMFGLALPVGLWLSWPRWWNSMATLVLVGVSLSALPSIVGLLPASPREWAGVLAALIVGPQLRSRLAGPPPG